MESRLVTIARFATAWEAELARASLECEGIPASVADANMATMNWLFSSAIGGVRLRVSNEFSDRALEVLSVPVEIESREQPADDGELVCPRCGGRNTTLVRRGTRGAFLS